MAPTSACAFDLQFPKPSLIFRCLISYDSVLHGAAERGTSDQVKLLTLRRAFSHPVTSTPLPAKAASDFSWRVAKVLRSQDICDSACCVVVGDSVESTGLASAA